MLFSCFSRIGTRRQSRAFVAVSGITLLLSGRLTPADAQMTSPALTTTGAEIRSVSAAEAQYHIFMKESQLQAILSFRDAHYPIDSMLQVVTATGGEWLRRLQQRPVTGLQHDPAGEIGVVAKQPDYANVQVAERLAESGLRLQDRAFTLVTAIKAYADVHRPEQLPTAERYLTQLDALGDSAVVWQLAARLELMNTYYLLGRSPDIIRHGITALQRVPSIPYRQQPVGIIGGIYLRTVDALSGQPDGRRRIDALNTNLRSIYTVPPEAVAVDSAYIREGERRRAIIDRWIAIAALLGTQGQPLISNYWVNRPTTDSAVVPVNDGKIRLIEIFSYGCDGCLTALYGLQRIQQRFPTTVEAVATTFTFGFWANRLVTPDEEAQKLDEYFVKQLKVTFPIAIWKWAKVLHEDGGYRRAEEDIWATPNGVHYPLINKPTTYVLDGHGRIRRIFVGGDRETEAQMLETVEFLQREAAHANHTGTGT